MRTFPQPTVWTIEAWRCRAEDGRGVFVIFHGYAASKSPCPTAKTLTTWLRDDLVDLRGSGGSTGRHYPGSAQATDVAAAAEYASRFSGDAPSCRHVDGKCCDSPGLTRMASPHAIVIECPFGRCSTP